MPLMFTQSMACRGKREGLISVIAIFCPYESWNFHAIFSIRYFTQKRENRPHQGYKLPLFFVGWDVFPCLIPIIFGVNYLVML
jgi:hypothetical protein